MRPGSTGASQLRLRFGIGSPAGPRSSEWVVLVPSKTSDVYIASRSFDGTWKASIHASGLCHVRCPSGRWLGPQTAPKFLQTWQIDVQAPLVHAFSVVIPVAELTAGPWAPRRQRPVVWIPAAAADRIAEVALLLSKTGGRPLRPPAETGWHTTLLESQLSDGRRLHLLAGDYPTTHDWLAGQERDRNRALSLLPSKPEAFERGTRRLLFLGVRNTPDQTRFFIELSARRAA